jgi:hypothetical protein
VDPFLTMEVLYQLSYEGGGPKRSGSRRNAFDARLGGRSPAEWRGQDSNLRRLSQTDLQLPGSGVPPAPAGVPVSLRCAQVQARVPSSVPARVPRDVQRAEQRHGELVDADQQPVTLIGDLAVRVLQRLAVRILAAERGEQRPLRLREEHRPREVPRAVLARAHGVKRAAST